MVMLATTYVGVFTDTELQRMNSSKAEIFSPESMEKAGYSSGSFDFALPQGWLDDFANWCGDQRNSVSYDLIRSTCVWTNDGIITCSLSVLQAYQRYYNSRGI